MERAVAVILVLYLLRYVYVRCEYELSDKLYTDELNLKWCKISIFIGTVALLGMFSLIKIFEV